MKLFLEAILGLAIAHSKYFFRLDLTFSYLDTVASNLIFNIIGGFAGAVIPDVLDYENPYYPSSTDQPPPDCHGNFTGPSDGTEGTITSPEWPNDYPANSACFWHISCEHGLFPEVSVHWGDVIMPIIWAEDAASSW